jgi:hypothetical protein
MENKIVVIKESVSESIISDIVTFGALLLCLYANYYWLGNSKISLVFIWLSLFLGIFTLKNKKVMSTKQAVKYLQDNQED